MCDCLSGCPDCRPIATDISEPWRYPNGLDEDPCLCGTNFTCMARVHVAATESED
jgi:hypothetical protein